MAMAGAVLCVLRARFFRLLVRRFGTAMIGLGQVGKLLEGLLGGITQGAKRLPAAVGRRGAAAVPGITIGAAAEAEPQAVLLAQRVGRRDERIALADGRAQVELGGVGVDRVHVGIVLRRLV